MKNLLLILSVLVPIVLVPIAQAQFNGYVGLQTVMTPVLTNSSATGRTLVNANIGASYHTFTYCLSTPSTAIQLIVEQSANGQPGTFAQVSPISEFPWQAINGNNCGVIRVGGYYSVLALNVLLLSGGTITAWYTGTAGPTDIFPPAVNSSGGTSPIECDQSATFQGLAPSAIYELVPGNPNQGIYVCGGLVSFNSATTSGSLSLAVGTTTNCGGITQNLSSTTRRPGQHAPAAPVRRSLTRGFPAKPAGRPPALTAGATVWFTYVTPTTPQEFPVNSSKATMRIPPTPAGTSLCFNVGPVGALTALTLHFAQF